MSGLLRRMLAIVLGIIGLADTAGAAMTIIVQNGNAAGAGFNDPTPAAPVGGNTGTTLGQQRLIALQSAANLWGATLTSVQPAIVLVTYSSAASCTSPEPATVTFPTVHRNFAGAPRANVNYPAALANKLANTDLSPGTNDFDVQVCIPGGAPYLGLDNNHGTQIDLVGVFVHAFAHGFGFWNATAANGGDFVGGFPSLWDVFLLDTDTHKLWSAMTLAERQASMRNSGKVVWTGANVSAAVPVALALGAPRVTIGGPEAGATANLYGVGNATFGTALGPVSVTGQLLPALRLPNGLGGACDALDPLDALALLGNVALIERGGCADAVQAKNVQNAGAIAAVLIEGSNATPAPAPTGSDPAVSIPTVALARADGYAIAARMTHRGRRASGVTASLGTDPTQYLGADPLGRAIVYTPIGGGTTILGHWDPRATPNQRMEPTIGGDVPQSPAAASDLTFRLLQDIGW